MSVPKIISDAFRTELLIKQQGKYMIILGVFKILQSVFFCLGHNNNFTLLFIPSRFLNLLFGFIAIAAGVYILKRKMVARILTVICGLGFSILCLFPDLLFIFEALTHHFNSWKSITTFLFFFGIPLFFYLHPIFVVYRLSLKD